MQSFTKEIIKNEFINIIKEYPHFPFHDRKAQEEVAAQLLEQVFEKTHVYVTSLEKKQLLCDLLDTVVFGLRQIQKLQDDPEIEEIMINNMDMIFVKRRFSDATERVPVKFTSKSEIRSVIEKLLEGTGRRIDRSSPLVDTRLADGSRVNIIIDPLSLQGPVITIRKFPKEPITADSLLKYETINQEMFDFLKLVVEKRKNIVISGSTAAGKTTSLAALLDFIQGGDGGDRVVLIEQIAELKLPERIINKVHLETRPSNIEGKGEYTIRDLLKNALRMRPDRIIIGEIRGEEAFDLLQALNTGHEGSFTTLHSNSAHDALLRLESMVLLAGFEQVPLYVIKTWIQRSVDFIIQQKRFPDGKRRIIEISAVNKEEQLGNQITSLKTDQLFTFEKGKFITNSKNLKKYIQIINQS